MTTASTFRGATQQLESVQNQIAHPLPATATNPRATWLTSYRWFIAGADFFGVGIALSIVLLPIIGLSFLPLIAFAAGLLVLLIGVSHGYDSRRAASGSHEYEGIRRASWMWACFLIGASYISAFSAPPILVCTGLVVGPLIVVSNRITARWHIVRKRRRGSFLRKTLLVGNPDHLVRLTGLFQERPEHGFAVVGACVPSSDTADPKIRVLGKLDDITQVIARNNVEVVIVAASYIDSQTLRHLCWRIEPSGVELLLAPDVEDVAAVRVGVQPVAGTPLLTVALGPTRMQLLAKTLLDRFLGIILLTAALIPLIAAVIAVRFTSAGSAFFVQKRIGQNGQPFKMLKLRTMYVDAESRLAELEHKSDGNDVMFKMRKDPRVTTVGRVLRRFSIDELPQLINVVRGDMSLVGPRPPLPVEVATYDYEASQRLRVKPGLTGLWQVSGRSDLDWEQTVRLDLDYVDNWSMLMDLTILLRTFQAVFGGRGAY